MKKNLLKKVALIFIILLGIQTSTTFATSEDCYIGEKAEYQRKENKLSGVTKEMCTVEYWKNKTIIDINKELMTFSEISKLNKDIVDGSGTKVFDLETDIKENFDADALKTSLANTEIPTRNLYINGDLIDNQLYFSALNEAIMITGYSGMETVKYAVCSNRADMKSWPIDDVIGYSEKDPDDEMESSAMNVNEPFVIKAKCEINEEIYYWGYSNNCTGWVNAKNLALFENKKQWTNYWKVNIEAEDFLVVTESRIDLKNEKDVIKIMLGTILKLASDEEIPEELENKKDSCYIVFFAGRDNNGLAYKKYAAIDKTFGINKGFLKLTQNNLLKVAFSCLGDEYGWGGMNGNMDCSLYTRSIYKCFGFELPRNTAWQQKTPGKFIDISNMSDEEKTNFISTLPAGALLFFSGHTMMYIGMDENKNFIVSDLGYACEEGTDIRQDVYAVNINSLNVKRTNGRTWLNSLSGIINLSNEIDIEDCSIILEEDSYVYDETEKEPSVVVKYNENEIYENINYVVEYSDNINAGIGKVTIKGINNFEGQIVKQFEINKIKNDVLEGKNQIIDISTNNTLKFRFDIDYEEFILNGEVYIDNSLVNDSNYHSESGSTKIVFNKEYVDLIKVGKHTITIKTANREASSDFNIIKTEYNNKKSEEKNNEIKEENKEQKIENTLKENNNIVKNPNTGDNIEKYIFIEVISIIASLIYIFLIKKFKRE